MSFQTSALLLSWVAILLLALVVAGLVRQVHALAQGAPRQAELGPPPGSAAPAFDRLGPGLLLFLDRDCGVCGEVLDAAGDLGRPLRAIFSGPAPTGLPPGVTVLAGEGEGLFTEYKVPATPFAVVVDEGGRIRASEPVGSTDALRGLLELEGAR
ncbi:hypothetical protein [Actinomadura macrotermitis]|uniref:Thioredoxin domain-containing protein n=1 Tax=Actinomadura macrotermitis TaxID=2585200 RepID=A0A7K0C3X3_9ACTN|nr:hypothetical protein [Actinomadura macrotermitis]MQY08141.1 hypothetical protein [Actinomadura macrotermitis]